MTTEREMNTPLLSRAFHTIMAAIISLLAYFETVHSVSISLIIFMGLLVLFNIDVYVAEQRMKGREW
jgi:hypothetical protein